MRLLVIAATALLAAAPAVARNIDFDFSYDLSGDDIQRGGSYWTAFNDIDAIALNVGDTLSGSVHFQNGSLALYDAGLEEGFGMSFHALDGTVADMENSFTFTGSTGTPDISYINDSSGSGFSVGALDDLTDGLMTFTGFDFTATYKGGTATLFAPNAAYSIATRTDILITPRVSYHPPVTPPSAVPEPSTWALLTVGFGLLGAMVRRRAALRAVLA